MNKQLELAKLKERLRGKFLGDVVIAALGQDLDIERFVPQRQETLAADVFNNFFKHSTIARIDESIVGIANTYWRGSEKQWTAIRQERMLQLLHRLDTTFSDCRYTSVDGTLQRTISARVNGGQLYIREQIFLNRLSQLTISWRSCCAAIKGGADDRPSIER